LATVGKPVSASCLNMYMIFMTAIDMSFTLLPSILTSVLLRTFSTMLRKKLKSLSLSLPVYNRAKLGLMSWCVGMAVDCI
jgi:hypothetical protein